MTSDEGVNWTAQDSGSTRPPQVYPDGVNFLAVGDTSVLISSDGEDFSPTAGEVSDVDWNGQQFYVVGNSGAFYISPDAVTWTDRNPGGNEALYGGVSANNGFVAVGASGTIIQSPDGQTWQARDSGTTGQLTSVAFSGSEYVAIGEGGIILRSDDGMIWLAVDSGTTRFLQDVVFAQQQFVVAAGSRGSLMSSADGLI